MKMDSPRTSIGSRKSPPVSPTLNSIPSHKVVGYSEEVGNIIIATQHMCIAKSQFAYMKAQAMVISHTDGGFP